MGGQRKREKKREGEREKKRERWEGRMNLTGENARQLKCERKLQNKQTNQSVVLQLKGP